jgi:hypothetical protein
MSNEIILSVAYDNYDDFQHIKFIFHKISFLYFDINVRYLLCSQFIPQVPNSSTLYHICFAQSPPLVNYMDGSKENITLGVLWECGKI